MLEDPNTLLALVAAVVLAAAGLIVYRVARRRRRPAAVAGTESLPAPVAVVEPPGERNAFRVGLAKTRQLLGTRLLGALRGDRALAARLDELEEVLITADIGVATTQRLIGALRQRSDLKSPEGVVEAVKTEVLHILQNGVSDTVGTEGTDLRSVPVGDPGVRPLVILVAGVNGVGKTTTIGKLAYRYQRQGKRVMMIAADTFRAAAIEQLEIWANRVGCEIIKHQSGSDPSAVAFDGIKAARSRGVDVAIVDTAGRLHVKVNLMEEMKKIVRVIGREMPGAPHEAFLVLDATTGQNAISQARLFKQALPLTGLILTKLDGTAKGGAVLAIKSELGLPLRYVGLGEGLEDLHPFEAEAFTEALFG